MKRKSKILILILILLVSQELKSQVNFTQATNLVINNVIIPSGDTSLVAYGYPILLDTGDIIASSDDSLSVKVINSPTWFFWVDQDKHADFAHSTKFIYIDTITSSVEVENWNWWPVINSIEIWSSYSERYNSSNVIYGSPPIEPTSTVSNPSGNIQGGDGSHSRVCIYMLSGSDEAVEKRRKVDIDNVDAALTQYFGVANIHKKIRRNNPTMAQICIDLDDFADENPDCDKFVYFFTGHSSQSYMALQAHPSGDDRKFTGTELANKLKDIDAPQWVMLQTCFAAAHIPPIEMADIEGHAVVASAADKCAYANNVTGGHWVRYITECLNNSNADSNDAGSDISPQEAQAWAENRLNNSGSSNQQNQDSQFIPLTVADTTATGCCFVFAADDAPEANNGVISIQGNQFGCAVRTPQQCQNRIGEMSSVFEGSQSFQINSVRWLPGTTCQMIADPPPNNWKLSCKAEGVPTLSQWGLIILALLTLIIGIISIKQSQIELVKNGE